VPDAPVHQRELRAHRLEQRVPDHGAVLLGDVERLEEPECIVPEVDPLRCRQEPPLLQPVPALGPDDEGTGASAEREKALLFGPEVRLQQERVAEVLELLARM
jgi:hypothetical protein